MPSQPLSRRSGAKAALTLNADQTFSLDGLACGGTLLTEGSWQLTETQCSNGQPAGTWSYADGAVTLVFADDADEAVLDVSLGGRMLSTAFNSFHAADPSSDTGMWIATRK